MIQAKDLERAKDAWVAKENVEQLMQKLGTNYTPEDPIVGKGVRKYEVFFLSVEHEYVSDLIKKLGIKIAGPEKIARDGKVRDVVDYLRAELSTLLPEQVSQWSLDAYIAPGGKQLRASVICR